MKNVICGNHFDYSISGSALDDSLITCCPRETELWNKLSAGKAIREGIGVSLEEVVKSTCGMDCLLFFVRQQILMCTSHAFIDGVFDTTGIKQLSKKEPEPSELVLAF